MCFSLPVVSTLWRGIPSIVEHGSSGFLIATHDHLQLSAYIQMLAKDAELCLRLGLAGREKFAAQFTVDKYVTGIQKALLELGRQ
jgi:glycosyltransferase involved in cell wall biosynthesis